MGVGWGISGGGGCAEGMGPEDIAALETSALVPKPEAEGSGGHKRRQSSGHLLKMAQVVQPCLD